MNEGAGRREEPARFGAFTVRTDCARCGLPVPVNGPILSPRCGACHAEVDVFPRLLGELLVLFDDQHGDLVEGAKARTHAAELPGHTLQCSYARAVPSCHTCRAPLSLEAALDVDTRLACSCGEAIEVYPPPDWMQRYCPTARQVFSAAREATAGGHAVAKVPDAAEPVVMPCPSCGAALHVAGDGERVTKCHFCGSEVFLPDELWRRLHPVRTVVEWFVRFAGETQSEERARLAAARAKEDSDRAARERAARAAETERARLAAIEAERRTASRRLGVWVRRHGLLLAAALVVAAGLSAALVLRGGRGEILVQVADPSGAAIDGLRIEVDGKEACESSPCAVRDLTPGAHDVTVSAAGYESTGGGGARASVSVGSGADAHVNLTLRRGGRRPTGSRSP